MCPPCTCRLYFVNFPLFSLIKYCICNRPSLIQIVAFRIIWINDLSWNWIPQTLLWRHNGRDGVSNHQPQHFLLKGLFRRRSKKTSKLRVTGLCVGNSPVTGEFPAQMASYSENVSIWWRHHGRYSRGSLWNIIYAKYFAIHRDPVKL